ncbi:MAG TPA: hypothetical protein PKV77_06425 [Bacteroidales bacterium]|nr:hypothetical protein [Bacteroidales bacterium]
MSDKQVNGMFDVSQELNAGYAFTKAQIAELEFLRKENADLKEQITQLRASCVSGFYYERIPQFSQGFPNHEGLELVTANEVQAYVDKIEELKRQLAESGEWIPELGD